MVVELAIYPLGDEHMAGRISEIVKIIDESGLEYQVGPMSTSIRGRWDEIMPVLKECHEAMVKVCGRVITNITIDEKRVPEYTLDERVERIEDQLAP